MTALDTGAIHDPYNDAAISLAERLHARRRAAATERTGEADLDRLFPDFNRVPLGVAREYERMGLRPVSAALAEEAAARGVRFEHLGTTLGTVLHGIDLNTVDDAATVAFLRATLLERKVIFFRDQTLDEDAQIAFARHFGDLDAFPFGKPGRNPYILEIVHGASNPGTENSWHTDVTWMEQPSLGSVAHCVELPDYGGDTLFADSHAAFLGLRPALQDRLRGLDGINDYRNFLRAIPEDLHEDFKAAIPFGVTHPLLRTHPETGKTALWFHGGFLRHESLHERSTGETLPAEEARAIVAELQRQHARPEYQCRFPWAPGSIAFWDNRAVQHYAASDYYPQRRVLRRVTVRGDRPFYDPARDPLDAAPA